MNSSKEGIIRKYENEDKEGVLSLLRLNTPAYFSPDEEPDLVHYLDNEIEYYYVLYINQQLIGCGGINSSEDGSVGVLSWDILHPDFQKQGWGTLLLKHRIRILNGNPDIQKIRVRTSGQAYRFYEKSGFRLIEKIKDYWAEGFDLYTMEYVKA